MEAGNRNLLDFKNNQKLGGFFVVFFNKTSQHITPKVHLSHLVSNDNWKQNINNNVLSTGIFP